MTSAEVSVNKGFLLVQTFSEATCTSSEVYLKGQIVLGESKVTQYSGSVYTTDGKRIGLFNYRNGSYEKEGDNSFSSSVTITNVDYESLQISAVSTLKLGIHKFENPE